MGISADEYRGRMERLQRLVAESGLEAFLVSSRESIYYLTGVTYEPLERPFFVVVRPDRPAELLVPALEKEHLSEAPNVGLVESYWDYPAPRGEGWPQRLDDLLKGVRELGVEPTLRQEIATGLGAAPDGLRVLGLVEKLRLVKSEAEVALLRQSARYAVKAAAGIIRGAYWGVSELELLSQGRGLQTTIIKELDEYDALNTSVVAGAWVAPQSAQPHGVPTVRDRLRGGPHITLTLIRVNGYASECERTFFLERPRGEVVKAFGAMMEARRRAYALVRPGTRCADIDVAAKGFLEKEGYGPNLLHRTGHGFGLGAHEGPWVAEGSEDALQANMAISIEPGIYLPGVGGVRHSDTVLVSRNGYENLTACPTGLDELTVRGSKLMARLKGALVRKMVGL